MNARAIEDMRILVVDDQPLNVALLEKILFNAGFTRVESTTDSREVEARVGHELPDLILLDLLMPNLDGFGVMERLAPFVQETGTYLPILVLTADASPETKRRALAAGAHDFLTKPFDPTEVELRLRNLLATRSLHLQLQGHAQLLEHKVHERTQELEEARLEILERLALAAEYRDDDTGRHTDRVGRACGLLSRAMGLPDADVELMRRASPLHDIGKIGVPDSILLKPGKLTAEEFAVMKQHTAIGARILSGSRFPLLRVAEQIALTHHERWDGSGYPGGLAGEDIPLPGRILAIVDVFDALISVRPYKRAWTHEEALAELDLQRGRHFDPRVLDAFLEMYASQGGDVWRAGDGPSGDAGEERTE